MRTPILDHGYLELIESWGSDERIVEAARMSTGKGFVGWLPEWKCQAGHARYGYEVVANVGGAPVCNKDGCSNAKMEKLHNGDEKLLNYLWTNKHATPFEMAGLVIEVQAPIMVFREWHRHRTQSYNEMSARYTPLPDLNYVPTVQRLMIGSDGKNRQAGTIKDAAVLTKDDAERFRWNLEGVYTEAEGLYQWALKAGVPKELARVHLPVGRYSRMRASANLRNWLAFLTLRMDKAAQFEIRQYANAVGSLIKQLFPRTWALFIGEGK